MELMDSNTLKYVQRHGFGEGGGRLLDELLPSDPSSPPATSEPLYLLGETQGSDENHDASKMDAFLERLFRSNAVANGFHARDRTRMAEMWGV